MMSQDFRDRLYPILPDIVKWFGTPFHIYDERGIKGTCQCLIDAFRTAGVPFQEFFAVKANPNPAILNIFREFGFGFDCSSIPELLLTRGTSSEVMFTSNNTSQDEFMEAGFNGGLILNLDDITLVNKATSFPELISFRYNPGPRRTGNSIIGDPVEAKYGVAHDQIAEAYRRAIKRGAVKFGIHTMICSNELNYKYMVETVRMLCDVMMMVSDELGIKFDFLNMGGGLGIPYRLEDKEIPIEKMAEEIAVVLEDFSLKGYGTPALFLESGRYITGPHGALITKCINQKHTYKEWRGVDASMSALMRPGMYWPDGGYHHINVYGKNDNDKKEVVSVVGSLCENCDQFARDRELPKFKEGDLLIIHDTGAHGHAMGFNYNARLRPKELMLKEDGSVVLIRREETFKDYTATLKFKERTLTF